MEERGPADVCFRCGWREGTRPESPLYLPPRTILDNQYLIGRVLGYGGFGITYLGWDMNLARKLAVKEYMPNGVASRASGDLKVTVFRGQVDNEFEYGMQQFLEEGRTVARFQGHAGIVKVIDFVRANGTAYLVMEYLDGCTLETYLQRNNGKIPFPTVLNIMAPVMDALRAVHKESFLHRDISPDNVFVLNNGGVKLIDFGAARFALSQRSKNLSVILKEGYAPPEQYSSKGNQGPWTDVYATAATMYRAITSKVPPPSLDRREADELEVPARMGVPLAPGAEHALMKGLAIRVADRYPSMEAFQAAVTGLPEDYFLEGSEQAFQELLGGVTRPLDTAGRPVHHEKLGVDPDATRRLDPSELQRGGRPQQPASYQKKLAIAAFGAVALLGLIWVFKPAGPDAGSNVPPAGCTYTLNLPMANIPSGGQQMKIPVVAGSGCPWLATTEAPWVKLDSSSGTGQGEVVYSVARNSGQYPRSAVINIGGQPHTVHQMAEVAPPASCNLAMNPAAVTAPSNGGSGGINVDSNCPWSANSDSTWIRVTGGAASSGRGRVTYSVAANNSPVPRTGIITIAGQVHRISQAGAAEGGGTPVANCRYTLNPPAANAPAVAANGRIDIYTGGNCGWTANTSVGWISIVSSPVGRGNGVLAFNVAPNNTLFARSGTISIGNSTFNVNQAAPAGSGGGSSGGGSGTAPPVQTDYDGIMRQANAAFNQRNYQLAGQLARQAMQMDPAKPDAYDLLGHMDLYLAGNVAAARENMSAAIARGGKATFSVRHDHSKLTFAQSCGGFLYIWRNKVAFDSREDRFEVSKTEVQEAKPNRSWIPVPVGPNNFRPQGSVFHIDTKYRKYNMAGTSRLQKEEMNMILNFIGK
jgi:serine/threonine protein kinase